MKLKRGSRYALVLSLSATTLVLAFQNCAPSVGFNSTGASVVDSAATKQGRSCDSHLSGASWMVDSGQTISVPQTCQFGGDLVSVYKKMIGESCNDGAVSPNGQSAQGDLISQQGACALPKCGDHDDDSTWSVADGVVKQTASCPDSTATILKDYQNLDQYICHGGQASKTGTQVGSYLGDEGSCPAPSLTAAFVDTSVAVGATSKLGVVASNVASVSYSCNDGKSSGTLALGSTSTSIQVNQDLTCTVTAMTSAGAQLTQTAHVGLTCNPDQTLQNGKCVNVFTCQKFVQITSWPAQIPARASDGTCYYAKLFSSVPSHSSSGSHDLNVVARLHGATNATNTANPFILGPGPASARFTLLGDRFVRLSGQSNSLSSIQVDNFLLIGLRPSSQTAAQNVWSAYGTADSTLPGTNYVQAYNQNVNLTPFGSGGTATISALFYDPKIPVNQDTTFDVHALDCGGIGALSDIYLIFQ